MINTSVFSTDESISLNSEEKKWLKNHPIIYYAPDPSYAPYEYYEDGELKGMTSDYLDIMEEILGVKFQIVDLKAWGSVIEAAKNNEIDMIFVTKTQDRNHYLVYTAPVLDYPNVIVSCESLKGDISEMNLDHYSLAYMKDYAVEAYVQLLYPDAHTIAYSDIEAAITDVSTGKVDTFLGDIGQISFHTYKMNVDNLIIKSETAYKYNFRFGFPKDQEILRNIMDKALQIVDLNKREDIHNKWIALQYNRDLSETQQLLLLFLLILLILVVITMSLWNRSLKKQVEEKISELKYLNEDLEDKVVERTKALEETNDELEVSVEELLSAQEKLVEAQKNALLGELIVGIAHELSTPVGSSLTSISYVQEKTSEMTMNLIQNKLSLKDVATYSDMTLQSNQSIINNLERMSKIIERFMSLETSQWNGHKEEAQLGDIFKDIINHVGEFDYRLMSYNIHCTDKSSPIITASSWWYEILKSLMLNSLLHGYNGLEKGNIVIDIKEVDNSIIIIYEDYGKGIEVAILEQVFEPFYTTSNDHEHIGLGLPIIKNLISREINGTMMIESELGAFTRIIIKIPKVS